MQMFNQYLNQFPATDQQIIQELLRQYESGDPQSRALAQRRLEPYTQQLLQMSTADRMQRRQDAFQADPAMPEESMATMVPERPERLLNLQDEVSAQSTFMPIYNPLSSVQPSRPENMTVDPMDLFPQRPIRFRQGFPKTISSAKTLIQEGPANPPTNKNSFDFGIPEVPQPSAPAQGLLDTEEPAEGGSFFDNPMSMGLIQAGLGLLSAPRYSTNPNDVTLSSALARGLGGFIQGYGGTKKRLSEEERQKIEDEYKRSQIEFDKLYKTALTNEAIGRTEQMKALLAKPAKDQKEWEAKVREIYPNPDNKTGQALIAAGPVEGAKKLAKLAGGMTETERKNLVEGIKKNPDLTDSEKAILIEMAGERNYEGNLANSSVAITNQMDDYVKQKKPDKPSDLNDGVMYSRLERGRRDPKYVETPEYAEAYGRYKDKALRPSLSQSGTATYIPRSIYPAPEGMEAQTTTSALSKVTQTPSGTQINQMNPDDSKEVRTLFSNIQKLEEFEKIVQNVDLNNMDRITSDSPEVARLSTIYNDLLLRLKEQPYNLGVITGPDMDLMESILDNPAKADPTNIRAFFRDKDYYLAKINQLRGILINDTQNVLQDYGGDVNQAYEQRFQRPLTWVPKTPPKTSRTSPKTKEILNQVEQPPAVAPVPNNGNESSLIDFLPDPIQNIFR